MLLVQSLLSGLLPAAPAATSVAPIADPAPADAEGRALAHLEHLRDDVRDEIKRRIEQRDTYSIQMTLAVGAIVAVGAGIPDVLVAAPLVVTFFTVLILYSYRMHRVLAGYLATMIEPELARLCGTDPRREWESYYKTVATPGIRRTFYLGALWFFNVGCPLYLVARGVNPTLAIGSGLAYVVVAIWITRTFWVR